MLPDLGRPSSLRVSNPCDLRLQILDATVRRVQFPAKASNNLSELLSRQASGFGKHVWLHADAPYSLDDRVLNRRRGHCARGAVAFEFLLRPVADVIAVSGAGPRRQNRPTRWPPALARSWHRNPGRLFPSSDPSIRRQRFGFLLVAPAAAGLHAPRQRELGASDWLSLRFGAGAGSDDEGEWLERLGRLLPPDARVIGA
ncbi:MAG: hypothetical protein ABSB88_27720, partial [Bryobacteraceae bacterium]